MHMLNAEFLIAFYLVRLVILCFAVREFFNPVIETVVLVQKNNCVLLQEVF